MDLSTKSTEELLAIVAGGQGGSGDISKMSTEELLAIVQGAAGPAPDPFSTATDDKSLSPELKPALEARAAAQERVSRGLTPERTGAGRAALLGGAQGILGNWGDEIGSGINAAIDYFSPLGPEGEGFGDAYRRHKQSADTKLRSAQEDNPWAYTGSNIAGAVASGVALPAVRGATGVATGLKTGAVYGGIAGAGEGNSLRERATNAGIGAGIGAGAGAAFGKVGDVLARRQAARVAKETADDALATLARSQADALPVPMGDTMTRGQLTGQIPLQGMENTMLGGGYGEVPSGIAQAARARQGEAIRGNVNAIASEMAGPSGRVIAHPNEMGETLASSIRQATSGVRDAARNQADDIARMAGRGVVDVGDEVETGAMVADAIRSRAAQAGSLRDAAYDAFAKTPGVFEREAVEGIDDAIRTGLTTNADDPLIVTSELTPKAAAALDYLKQVGSLAKPRNAADPMGNPPVDSIAGYTPTAMNTVRKNLNQFWRAAKGEDRRAVTRIIGEFDNHLQSAIDDGLFSGDPTALERLRTANRMHREWMQTFRPDARRNPAANAMRSILEKDATPEQVSNYLFGSAKLGSRADSAAVAAHIRQIVGQNSPEWAAIRQGGWKWMTRFDGDLTPKTAQEIASRIEEFTSRRGSTLARQLFDSSELQRMQTFASNLRAVAGRKGAPPEAMAELMKIADGTINPQVFAQTIVRGSKNTAGWRAIEAAESIFGQNSEEMAQIRQAVWREITGPDVEGIDRKGAQALSQRIANFVNGDGRVMANRLFDQKQRKEMADLARTLKRVAGDPAAKNPPNTAAAWLRSANDKMRAIMGALGIYSGDVTTFLAMQGAKTGDDLFQKARANALFSGHRPPQPVRAVGRGIARGATKGAMGLRRVSGPEAGVSVPAFADEDEIE